MQCLSVYKASDFHIVNGVNLGDSLSFAEDLILDDTYMLAANAGLHKLSIAPTDAGLRIDVKGNQGDASNQFFL